MNPDIMKQVFPEEMKRIAEGLCPFCKQKIGEFRDALSLKEFHISGLCQNCQDDTFGK